MNDTKTVLVTGSCGMIGSYVTDKLLNQGYRVVGIDRCDGTAKENYVHITLKLEDKEKLAEVFENLSIDRIVHLAALAHTPKGVKVTYEQYYNANVVCAENIFTQAAKHNIPILFISTVDVFGFAKGIVDGNSEIHPVTPYGKTKAVAEARLKEICSKYESSYTIYRLSPVYTETVKRDIQKRYYLKYPNLAYIIGEGTDYEVLDVNQATKTISDWVEKTPQNEIQVIKDEIPLNTAEVIKKEQGEGRAIHVLKFPKWLINMGFVILKTVTGKNKYTYLLNKAVNPIRTQ